MKLCYFYTRYVEEAGIFPLNSSSLFHFIKLGNTSSNDNSDIDFESIRIIGIDLPLDNYLSNNNLTKFNHWLYGPCNKNDIDNKTIDIKQEFPEKSACIRRYFNSEKKQYYNTTEIEFKWPILMNGCSSENSTTYGIIMEKCRNDSLKNNCKSNSEIDDYIKHIYGILFFIDNYVELLDYKKPFVKYLYKLTNGFSTNSFTINNLNFNPSSVTDSDGIFVNYKSGENSYQFTQNEKSSSLNSQNTTILLGFYFWLQNIQQKYERNFEKFQDLLSNIGGIGSFIILIANIINSLMTNYIILLDTEELVLNLDKHNYTKNNFNLKPTILKKASEILNPPKSKNNFINNSFNRKQQSSVLQILLKDRLDLNNNNNYVDAKSEPFKKLNIRKNNKINICTNYQKKITHNEIIPINIYKRDINNFNNNENIDKKIINDSKSMNMSAKDSINELETIKKDNCKFIITKQNFTWFKYLIYLLLCKTKNKKINYYEQFRTQIISEENLIQNHINVYKLLNV